MTELIKEPVKAMMVNVERLPGESLAGKTVETTTTFSADCNSMTVKQKEAKEPTKHTRTPHSYDGKTGSIMFFSTRQTFYFKTKERSLDCNLDECLELELKEIKEAYADLKERKAAMKI